MASKRKAHGAEAGLGRSVRRRVDQKPYSDDEGSDGGDPLAHAPTAVGAASDWEEVAVGLLHRCWPDAMPAAKVAAFDMDGTLIVTRSGKVHATDASDWKLLDAAKVPAKLRQLHAEGYKIVLFSNQLPVGKGRVTAADMQRKFDAIVARLGVPVEVFIATEENEFRKPRPGMWDMFVGKFNGGVRPDPAQSFFVGDAAGRPKDGPRKKDFSASDYKFASNIGLPFHTPEAFFLGAKSRLHTEPALWQVGSTVSDLRAAAGQPLFRPPHASLPAEADAPEILLLVGPPASGKSTFCKAHLPNYERVNQDTLKTVAKCRQAAAEAVRAGKRVVVDSTNRDRAARAGWVELARELTVPVRCYYFDLPKELPAHLNEFRGLVPSEDRRRLSSIVFRVFQGKHEPPGAEEGLAEVRRVNFVPLTFEDEATERLFYSFLV